MNSAMIVIALMYKKNNLFAVSLAIMFSVIATMTIIAMDSWCFQ